MRKCSDTIVVEVVVVGKDVETWARAANVAGAGRCEAVLLGREVDVLLLGVKLDAGCMVNTMSKRCSVSHSLKLDNLPGLSKVVI